MNIKFGKTKQKVITLVAATLKALLSVHSPLRITEVHYHSDALAPDEGKRVPFSAGISVSYNYVDLKFKNTTDQYIQTTICQLIFREALSLIVGN